MKYNKFYIFSIILGAAVLGLSRCAEPVDNVHPLKNSWDFAVPNQEVPEGLTSLSSAQCGACHTEIYKEWQYSTHSKAWVDLQFQAELKKESSPFMCINCHIPLQNQQEFIVTGLIDGDIYKPVKEVNPHYDKELQQEGINCASCHVRNNVIIGTSPISKAPHKTVQDTDFLSEKLCISCHNANAVITPTLACTFQTGDEWKAGPFFGEKNCISCHMEATTREIVPGFGERKSHVHFFAGSGIPKFDSVETKGLNGLVFYPSDLKKGYKIGEQINYTLRLKNELAGHRVPTGDPERYFLVTLKLSDGSGKILSEKSERIGEEWQWYPTAKKLTDNNFNPQEERDYDLTYLTEKEDHLILSVTVEKHRLNQESADYNKLGDNYPLYITIFSKEYNIQVTL